MSSALGSLMLIMMLFQSFTIHREFDINNYTCPHKSVCAKLLQSYLILCDSVDCGLPCSSVHGDSPAKNTGVNCRALLQGIFLTQESNPWLLCLVYWQVGSLPPAPQRKPPHKQGLI